MSVTWYMVHWSNTAVGWSGDAYLSVRFVFLTSSLPTTSVLSLKVYALYALYALYTSSCSLDTSTLLFVVGVIWAQGSEIGRK